MAVVLMRYLTVNDAVRGLEERLVLILCGHRWSANGENDVKLMAAIGAIVGPRMVFSAFLATAVAGGVFAVVVAFRRGRLQATLDGTRQLVASPSAAKETIEAPGRSNRFAYGPAIAVGTLVAVLMR